MAFTKISLTGYKNYQSAIFHFDKRIVGICGLNGKGKTNLLDAINYLCFTKSYFSKTDTLNIFFGAEGFRLEAELSNGQNGQRKISRIVCIYRSALKKEFYLDDIAYDKFSHHIGKFPCVMIAPDDIEMITGGSEERRKFLDTLISQVDAEYLRQLIVYNKVLQQRNGYIKNESFQSNFDAQLLDTLDEQLVPPGIYIHNVRQKFCEKLIPLVQKFYKEISSNDEVISLAYSSHLNEHDFGKLLKSYRKKDMLTQRTNTGIHKDDLIFLLHDNNFKTLASQGQRKSLLFACKLAEFEILCAIKGAPPLLLLDDVFEKLDELRMKNLLQYVCKKNSGQVFITDTHRERLENALAEFDNEVQIIELPA
ncbi:MAG: DNA replication and repair protein RecF [Bacteroidota bacterium]|nr:DNA replication and repair protein RecF [Bacteroidota bacterium]